jgi:hypothetical protein
VTDFVSANVHRRGKDPCRRVEHLHLESVDAHRLSENTFFGANMPIFMPRTPLGGVKTCVFESETDIHAASTSVPAVKTHVFGAKTSIVTTRTALAATKTSMFGANMSIVAASTPFRDAQTFVFETNRPMFPPPEQRIVVGRHPSFPSNHQHRPATMTDFTLVYPMFAMVLLTATVLTILFRSRVRAVREKKINSHYFRIYQGEVEPEETAKPARHFSNLFEAPTLFYAACITAMVTHDTSVALQALAWAYVVARVAHAWIHLGRNRIGQRIKAYFAGWLALLAIWVHIVVHVTIGMTSIAAI